MSLPFTTVMKRAAEAIRLDGDNNLQVKNCYRYETPMFTLSAYVIVEFVPPPTCRLSGFKLTCTDGSDAVSILSLK